MLRNNNQETQKRNEKLIRGFGMANGITTKSVLAIKNKLNKALAK